VTVADIEQWQQARAKRSGFDMGHRTSRHQARRCDKTIATLIPTTGSHRRRGGRRQHDRAPRLSSSIWAPDRTLAERILGCGRARLIGIDADPTMLATATRRLRGQIETIEDNFGHSHPRL
jgi:hypothetical protein